MRFSTEAKYRALSGLEVTLRGVLDLEGTLWCPLPKKAKGHQALFLPITPLPLESGGPPGRFVSPGLQVETLQLGAEKWGAVSTLPE